MPLTEARKRAISKWNNRPENIDKVRQWKKEASARAYKNNAEAIKEQARDKYKQNPTKKLAENRKRYYLRKEWNILCAMDIF